MRYVADMRRCQYVVQCSEGVRRRQRLTVEYVERRAGDVPVLQHADQRLLVDDRPLKHDGFRALVYVEGHRCHMVSRRGHTFTKWNSARRGNRAQRQGMRAVLEG